MMKMFAVHGCKHGKETAPDPCLLFTESDSKLYTNFKFCEKNKSHNFFKHIDLQSQENYVDKKNPRNV